MKRLILILISVIISVNLFAQWFAEANIGYGLATNKKDNDWFYNTEIVYDDISGSFDTESFPNKFTIAQSQFINIKGGYQFDKIELGLGFTYYDNTSFESFNKNNSFHRERRFYFSEENNIYRDIIYDRTFSMRRYVFSPEITYIFDFNSLYIYPSLSFSFQFMNIYEIENINSLIYDDSSSDNPDNYLTEIYHYKYPISTDFKDLFIIKPGLHVSYRLNSKISLYCKFTYNYSFGYSAEIKFRTLYERKSNNTTITVNPKFIT